MTARWVLMVVAMTLVGGASAAHSGTGVPVAPEAAGEAADARASVSHTNRRPMAAATRPRARELGIRVGVLPVGKHNAITDVPGVRVGHRTVTEEPGVRTGVTVVLPHADNVFQQKVPAAVYLGNAFGKLAGSTQVQELGEIETPIALTNTLSVHAAIEGLVRYTLEQPGNEAVLSVNAVVGETNDGRINDIRRMRLTADDVEAAIAAARPGPVQEGAVGAGAGTVAFGYKGGIGSSSRVVLARYTVGVLVQSNYGGVLQIAGVPIGLEIGRLDGVVSTPHDVDGSCMMVVATDAPLDARNLQRLAKRALAGLARTGAAMSNGSGDYVIAFSTAYRLPHGSQKVAVPELVANDAMTPLFVAAAEATEEALYNSLFTATTTRGQHGKIYHAIDIDAVIALIDQYGGERRVSHGRHGRHGRDLGGDASNANDTNDTNDTIGSGDAPNR